MRCLFTGLDRSKKVRLNSLNLVNRHHFNIAHGNEKMKHLKLNGKRGNELNGTLKGDSFTDVKKLSLSSVKRQ